MDKEKDQALDKLRELGILHPEKKQSQSAALSKLFEKKTRVENALILLGLVAEEKKQQKKKKRQDAAATFSSPDNNEDPVAVLLALSEEKKNFQEQLVSLTRERVRIEKWGYFEPAAFAAFSEQGIVLIPYELTPETYDSIGDEVKLIVLEKTKTAVRVIACETEIPTETPFVLPEYSIAEIDRNIEKFKAELLNIDEKLISRLPFLKRIKAEHDEIIEQIEFETARAGMEILVEETGEDFEGRTISWITGYIPADRLGALRGATSENGWAFTAVDPGPDDPVPTLLKNNRFVKFLEPLTSFLDITPGYREIDVSPFFLVFFVLYFGMIFGDAGYGILLLLAGLIVSIKTAKKGVPAGIKLLLLLGSSNFLWGVLTCSWFGIGDMDRLPAILKSVSLPLISSAYAAQSSHNDQIVQQNLIIFCFSLALLQLSIGRILAIIHNKTLGAFGHVGSIAMLIGMYFIILSAIASNEARQIPLLPLAVPVFAVGFILNFIFASYDGSVGRSILDSFKNIISVLLGIANVFSDIMSYIRLWAVALAGAAIASTVNTMAGPMLGHFMFFIVGLVLLVFGHGLNLVLNALAVLVHGVRLNILEFSSHVGLNWTGFAYKPFTKRIIN